MLLDLWFHHANPPRMGVFHARPKIERKKENDEALLLALGLL